MNSHIDLDARALRDIHRNRLLGIPADRIAADLHRTASTLARYFHRAGDPELASFFGLAARAGAR